MFFLNHLNGYIWTDCSVRVWSISGPGFPRITKKCYENHLFQTIDPASARSVILEKLHLIVQHLIGHYAQVVSMNRGRLKFNQLCSESDGRMKNKIGFWEISNEKTCIHCSESSDWKFQWKIFKEDHRCSLSSKLTLANTENYQNHNF